MPVKASTGQHFRDYGYRTRQAQKAAKQPGPPCGSYHDAEPIDVCAGDRREVKDEPPCALVNKKQQIFAQGRRTGPVECPGKTHDKVAAFCPAGDGHGGNGTGGGTAASPPVWRVMNHCRAGASHRGRIACHFLDPCGSHSCPAHFDFPFATIGPSRVRGAIVATSTAIITTRPWTWIPPVTPVS